MSEMNCCLTLILPQAIEEHVVDFLLKQRERVKGFTSCAVDGHGRGTRLQSVAEQVRGRARRVQIKMVLNEADARAVLDAMKETFGRADVVYWLSPVTEFGSFL